MNAALGGEGGGGSVKRGVWVGRCLCVCVCVCVCVCGGGGGASWDAGWDENALFFSDAISSMYAKR